jgi:hypothetical protein
LLGQPSVSLVAHRISHLGTGFQALIMAEATAPGHAEIFSIASWPHTSRPQPVRLDAAENEVRWQRRSLSVGKKSSKTAPGAGGQTNVNLGPAVGGGHSGRQLQGGQPGAHAGGRGASMQGEKQDARGGPQGANQGGASRGSSRLEPSHDRRNPEHHTGKKKPAK